MLNLSYNGFRVVFILLIRHSFTMMVVYFLTIPPPLNPCGIHPCTTPPAPTHSCEPHHKSLHQSFGLIFPPAL
ncbi:hypothetical protein T08_15298 [Trichinella sp. T8]|nr:hypothetical protein T08_15298 [Trichinella sp. T8]